MTREQLLEKSLGDLREIAKLQGAKSLTKYRKHELVEIIMNGGIVPDMFGDEAAPVAAETAEPAEAAAPAAQDEAPPPPAENAPPAPPAGPREDSYEQRPRYQQPYRQQPRQDYQNGN